MYAEAGFRAPGGGAMTNSLDVERCWQAVLTRDASQNGAFFYGVLTTGVFCHPGCPARTPRRANVRFYATALDAARDGLRPCLRCRPLLAGGPVAQKMAALCRYIEAHSGDPITLADLSREADMSPAHLQRTFKAVVGVSPKQFQENCRMRSFKSMLRRAGENGVTGAIFEAGYGSVSRVYEKLDTRLGMTPMEYRAGGRGVEISYASWMTRLGRILIGATGRGLCFLEFGQDESTLLRALKTEYPEAGITPMRQPPSREFLGWMASLNRYLEGQEPDLRLPVHVRATAFQIKVWTYLQSIPAGSVESYSEVAAAIGQPGAARAVARACATNHVALAIPCHRVIRGTGELGGYRWGLDRKRTLLDIEGARTR